MHGAQIDQILRLQEWAQVEGGKLRLLAQHCINLTYRTPEARCDVLRALFDVIALRSARHPKIRVLKKLVASSRGLAVAKLDSKIEKQLSSDSFCLTDVEAEDCSKQFQEPFCEDPLEATPFKEPPTPCFGKDSDDEEVGGNWWKPSACLGLLRLGRFQQKAAVRAK